MTGPQEPRRRLEIRALLSALGVFGLETLVVVVLGLFALILAVLFLAIA